MKKSVLRKTITKTMRAKQEAAIKMQLRKIEHDYEQLIKDITKEYGLVRHWVMDQLDLTRNRLKNRMG